MAERKYILQSDDRSCMLITVLNAHIHRYGFSPLEYDSDEYWQFYKNCETNRIKKSTRGYYPEIFELCKAKRVPFEGHGRDFKKWVYSTIAEGNYIDFSGWVNNMHSFLVAEYNKEFDTFMCVNSGIYSNEVVQYLPYPLLIKSHLSFHQIEQFKNISVSNMNKRSAAIVFDKK